MRVFKGGLMLLPLIFAVGLFNLPAHSQTQAPKTGEGPRGTPVAPSTMPSAQHAPPTTAVGKSTSPSSPNAGSDTGSGTPSRPEPKHKE